MTQTPPRVYLDTNVFIAAFEAPGAVSDHAWWVLGAIEDGTVAAVTSELTLAELLVKPLERADDGLAEAYRAMIAPAPGFEAMPVSRTVLIEAAGLRARHRALRLPDAIHLATALLGGCGTVISEDIRIPSGLGVTPMRLDPFVLDTLQARRSND